MRSSVAKKHTQKRGTFQGEEKDKRNTRSSEGSYLNAMLEAVKFPASIADLNTGLADVDRNALSHCRS